MPSISLYLHQIFALDMYDRMNIVPKDMEKAMSDANGMYDDSVCVNDSELTIAYNEFRHRERIEGSKKVTQTWRMKERVCKFVLSVC